MAEHQCATREVCPGDHGWQPDGQRRIREESAPAGADGGWVRTTDDAGQCRLREGALTCDRREK